MIMPPFGLTQQQSYWLAFRVGQSLYVHGLQTTGRDVMRSIQSRWDQLGCPGETWPDFEQAIVGDDTPFLMSTVSVQVRAIQALAGPCPIDLRDGRGGDA
jgi:hypothetical protein